MRYHEYGYGPPLVLLHGSGPDVTGWHNFHGVLGAFGEFYRCLVLEHPGVATALDALTQFVDTLQLDSVDIIGNAMGGGVAITYAIAHPEKVRRLVTVGGLGCGLQPWEGIHRITAPTLITWGRDDRVSPLDMALIALRAIPNAELHVFPNCGHGAMIEQRDAFVTTVLSFLLHKESN
nr:alpha/beta fold hydrolase [Mycobacterium sp. QGD 101]